MRHRYRARRDGWRWESREATPPTGWIRPRPRSVVRSRHAARGRGQHEDASHVSRRAEPQQRSRNAGEAGTSRASAT
eukprot:775509-Prymnesium_polylepis.1